MTPRTLRRMLTLDLGLPAAWMNRLAGPQTQQYFGLEHPPLGMVRLLAVTI